MKSCGVIVEYNPFHNGHRYHLEQARQKSQADVVIAIMSGNFLQRGEPAILDKWTRAEQALVNGADLIIELPVCYAIQSADYFAKGGIKLLHSLGVTDLCFGTDSASELDYEAFAKFNSDNEEIISKTFSLLTDKGMSYPQQMTEVYRQLYPEWPLDFNSPNHILGMSYAKENQKYPKQMTLHPLKRVVSNYHDKEIISQQFASATAIREAALNDKLIEAKEVMPNITYRDLEQVPLIDWNRAWPYLKYQLLTKTPEDLAAIYQMVEGIEYRLIECVKKATSFANFVNQVKSKRFTWARIQRLCVYVFLNITEKEMMAAWDAPYLRILGFNDKGRKFLNDRRKTATLPLITKVCRDNEKQLELDIKAGKLYQLLTNESKDQDFARRPIYLKMTNSFKI